MALLTFGYAGRDAADVAALIEAHQIGLVVDVRYMPWGKEPFRGPKDTAAIMRAGGARYRWLRGLGNVNYRSDGPVLLANPADAAILVAELEAGHRVALMCMCRRPAGCHRLDVADLIRAQLPDVEVLHL